MVHHNHHLITSKFNIHSTLSTLDYRNNSSSNNNNNSTTQTQEDRPLVEDCTQGSIKAVAHLCHNKAASLISQDRLNRVDPCHNNIHNIVDHPNNNNTIQINSLFNNSLFNNSNRLFNNSNNRLSIMEWRPLSNNNNYHPPSSSSNNNNNNKGKGKDKDKDKDNHHREGNNKILYQLVYNHKEVTVLLQ